jgi:hypothetical protein
MCQSVMIQGNLSLVVCHILAVECSDSGIFVMHVSWRRK